MTTRLSEDQPVEDDLAAIQAGIDDMEAGRVASWEEVDARLREKLGLPRRDDSAASV